MYIGKVPVMYQNTSSILAFYSILENVNKDKLDDNMYILYIIQQIKVETLNMAGGFYLLE